MAEPIDDRHLQPVHRSLEMRCLRGALIFSSLQVPRMQSHACSVSKLFTQLRPSAVKHDQVGYQMASRGDLTWHISTTSLPAIHST